jgi:hypothetical protein
MVLCEPRARETRSGHEQDSETGDERHRYGGTTGRRRAVSLRSFHVSTPRRRTPDRRPRMLDCVAHYSDNPVIRGVGDSTYIAAFGAVLLQCSAGTCRAAAIRCSPGRGAFQSQDSDDVASSPHQDPGLQVPCGAGRARAIDGRSKREDEGARESEPAARSHGARTRQTLTFGGEHSSIAILSAS